MAWTEKYVTTDGTEAWATNSLSNPSSLTEAVANYAAGERINVKAGTYSSGATNREFTTGGTETSPIWWRGYKTTPGDLDSRPTTQRTEGTDMPLFTSTTGRYYFLGSYQKVSNIHFTSGYVSAGTVMARGNAQVYHRCRIISTAAGGIGAIDTAGAGHLFSECYFENTTTGADVIKSAGTHTNYYKCIVKGGDIGIVIDGGKSVRVINCIVHGTAGSNITTGGYVTICGCTLYNAGLDNITIGTRLYDTQIIGNVFDTAGGYAINQNTGTDASTILLANNMYRDGSFTSGRLNGITEDLEFESVNETVIPFENAGSLDFSLKNTSVGYGLENLFEVDGPSSYQDLGAVQHEDAGGGGGGGFRRISLNGGFNG